MTPIAAHRCLKGGFDFCKQPKGFRVTRVILFRGNPVLGTKSIKLLMNAL